MSGGQKKSVMSISKVSNENILFNSNSSTWDCKNLTCTDWHFGHLLNMVCQKFNAKPFLY